MINFKNKNILITGASGGIGNELVKKFVSLGGNVLGSGTKSEKLDKIKKQYPKLFNNISTRYLTHKRNNISDNIDVLQFNHFIKGHNPYLLEGDIIEFHHQKKFIERKPMTSILIGIFLGLLFFPSPDFSKSLLVGILLPFDLFHQIISSSLLFWSFLLATVGPVIVIMSYDSFKR